MYFKRISDLHPVIEYDLNSLWVEASQTYSVSGETWTVKKSSPMPRLLSGETRDAKPITSFEDMANVDGMVSRKVSLAEILNNVTNIVSEYANLSFITSYYIEGKDNQSGSSGNKNYLYFNIPYSQSADPHISTVAALAKTQLTATCNNGTYNNASIAAATGAALTINDAGITAKQAHIQYQFSVNYIAKTSNSIGQGISANCTGITANNIYVPGTATLTAAAAYWADLAELYKSDANYPVGTLVKFGGEQEITIADTEVNAVITENPAYLMNTQIKTLCEFPLGIVLTGRSKIRVIGPVKKFDKMVLSQIPGIAIANDCTSNIIGIALEENLEKNEKLVNAVLKMSF